MFNPLAIAIAALLTALGIGLEAFLAHSSVNPESLKSLEHATRYQIVHSLAVILAVLINSTLLISNKILYILTTLFLTGIILFCGSIYLVHFYGATVSLAPYGGVCFIAGWALLAIGVISNNRDKGSDPNKKIA